MIGQGDAAHIYLASKNNPCSRFNDPLPKKRLNVGHIYNVKLLVIVIACNDKSVRVIKWQDNYFDDRYEIKTIKKNII